MIDLYLAAVKLGVIFVPINILYREREIAHITGDAEPRFVITEADLSQLVSDNDTGPSKISTPIRRPRSSTPPGPRVPRRALY